MSFVQGTRANVGSIVASELVRLRDMYCCRGDMTHSDRILVPCIGMAGVAQHLNDYFVEVDVCDNDPDVMCLWEHVLRRGWSPLVGAAGCTLDQWENLRRMRPGITPRRGYLGRICSSAGPFGRWRDPCSGSDNFDYLREGAMYIETARPKMRNVNLLPPCSFEQHSPPRGSVVYLDMPDDFADMEAVFSTANAWASRGVLVVVSATQAPDGWQYVYGNVCQSLYIPTMCTASGWGAREDVPSMTESISGTACPICERTVIYTDASHIAQCCGSMFHAACLSAHIMRQGGGSGCPSCGGELWPSDNDDSDYVESGSDSDDHMYSEDSNGIDTQA